MDYRNYCDREVIQLKDDFMKKEIMFEDLINKVFEIGFESGKKYAIKNAEKTIGLMRDLYEENQCRKS